MDFVGTSYGLWYYTGKVIPTIPVFVPWDFCVLPVFIALLIEYKPHFSPLVKAMIFAGVSAFIGEPVFLWLGFYVMVNWNILISFPIYFLIYLASYKIGTKKTLCGVLRENNCVSTAVWIGGERKDAKPAGLALFMVL
ncbi:CBO0543 family protein [Cohnella rhizosphaerae]|uniref:CBO0543 family protein n=1 Tax=Cohnella rhizosphaerae TaxID=1457232 RepID=UPI003B8A9101